MNTLSRTEIEQVIRELLHKYHAEYALLFGSYARGEATAASDIDVIVVGGANFRPRDIFAFGDGTIPFLYQKYDDMPVPFHRNIWHRLLSP